MNGFSTEEDSRDGPPAAPFYGQSCCLIDDGDRCVRPAGNASFSKRIQKSISQKKLKLDIDKSVSCGLRRCCPPPPSPPAAEPAGRAVPFPARHRTAVPPAEAALPAPRVGGRPAESCFSARRVELCDCPAGFSGPLQAAGRGAARGDALWCKLGSSGPRFPVFSATTLR